MLSLLPVRSPPGRALTAPSIHGGDFASSLTFDRSLSDRAWRSGYVQPQLSGARRVETGADQCRRGRLCRVVMFDDFEHGLAADRVVICRSRDSFLRCSFAELTLGGTNA